MALSAFAEFLADDALVTPPIASTKHPKGKAYRIESPDAETGLRLQALANLGFAVATDQDIDPEDAARLQLDDGGERNLYAQVLGPTLDELVADGVSWVRIQRIGRYAFAHFALGPEAAVKVAEGGTSGEAPAPNRATRRASSGTARSTRSRGSTAGTTSRRKPAGKG